MQLGEFELRLVNTDGEKNPLDSKTFKITAD